MCSCSSYRAVVAGVFQSCQKKEKQAASLRPPSGNELNDGGPALLCGVIRIERRYKRGRRAGAVRREGERNLSLSPPEQKHVTTK